MNSSANPAPLGLMGFGMTTILLNIHNAGFFPLSAMVLAMGFFYGGIAQIIAGIFEFKKGNTFAVTAFISYGLFWLSLVILVLAPKWGWAEATPEGYMGWYLFIWGVFTLFWSWAPPPTGCRPISPPRTTTLHKVATASRALSY